MCAIWMFRIFHVPRVDAVARRNDTWSKAQRRRLGFGKMGFGRGEQPARVSLEPAEMAAMKNSERPKARRRKKLLALPFREKAAAAPAPRRWRPENVGASEGDQETVYSSSLPSRAFERGDLFKDR